MLVLPALAPSPVAGSAAYADRDDSHLAWILPAGVSIEHAFNDVPGFTLLRYRNESGTGGGGVLRLRLGWSPAAAQAVADATTRGWRVVPVPLTSVRSRVVRRVVVGGDAQAIGPWTRVTTGARSSRSFASTSTRRTRNLWPTSSWSGQIWWTSMWRRPMPSSFRASHGS